MASNDIGVDILKTRNKEYCRHVRGRREATLGNLFASPFLQKIEISDTSHSNIKYYAGQEIQPGPPKSHDVSEKKYLIL